MVCFFFYDQTDLSDSKYNPLALQGISESEVRSDLQNYFFLLCYFVMKKKKFRAATSTIKLCVNLGLAPWRKITCKFHGQGSKTKIFETDTFLQAKKIIAPTIYILLPCP
jgi:hypothetical protein